MKNRRRQLKFVRIATVALLGLGCSPENPNQGDYTQQYIPPPTNAVDSAVPPAEEAVPFAGVGGVQTGSGSTSATFSDATVVNTEVNTPLVIDAACAAFSAEATQREVQVPTQVEVEVVVPNPVALYLMLDQSGSMKDPSSTSTKWEIAVSAINQFVADSTGVELALQYFPLIFGDCDTGSGYNLPEVSMGRLPDNADAITSSLSCHTPGGGGLFTPIEGALRGVTGYCSQFMQNNSTNPDGKECVAVLITDGRPTTCEEHDDALIDIAANAYTVSNVRTFTIGMDGADFSLLDRIAQAGKGDCTPDPTDYSWACNVSTGNTTFLDALESIRGSIIKLETRTEMQTQIETEKLDCEWAIPDSPAEQTFDKDKVNVQFSPDGQSQHVVTLGRVDSEADCLSTRLSWYYDDSNNPTAIAACPQTCDTIKTTDTGKISILFGCKTVLAIY